MAVVFATIDDLRSRWPAMPADTGQVQSLLEDAGVWLLSWFPSIPDEPSGRLADALRMVSCAMVKRALLSEGFEHVDSVSDSAGPFSRSRSFRNPDGNLFLTRQERLMIERALGRPSGMASIEGSGM